MKPFRLKLDAECGVSLQQLQANYKTVKAPRLTTKPRHDRKLAIVGGGPSIKKHLEELRTFDGDIWSINSTGSWLLENGIKSTFVSVDPSHPSKFKTDGMEEAILASCCHPELREQFTKCQFFDMAEQTEDGVLGGTTTASRVPILAVRIGYGDISLFGCEGSFKLNYKDHIDRDTGIKDLLIIKSEGKEYTTFLQLLLQCEHLADLIGIAPKVFKNKSGGLLDVFINDPDGWTVAAVSGPLKEKIEDYSGKHGRFEQPYQPGRVECASL